MANFDSNKFEKHQKLLMKLAKSRWTRWLLGLHRLPKELKGKDICQITPNSIHWVKSVSKKGKPKFQSAFFTAPRFAEALAYNLSPFVYFKGLRAPLFQVSPIGAIGMIVAALIPKVGFLGFMGTTTTFYAGTGNGNVDGLSTASWATARGLATGTSKYNNPSTEDNWFECYRTGSTYIIFRNFYPCDTSSLTASASISAASLNYFYVTNTNVNGVGNVVVATTQASTSTLELTDFPAVGTVDFGRKLWSSHTSNAMNFIDLNASGIAVISLTGTTQIGIRNTRDFDDSAPTGNNYAATRYQAYTGTSSDPYLSVTYTTAVGPTNLKTLDGVVKANIKTINGVALASVKTWNGVT